MVHLDAFSRLVEYRQFSSIVNKHASRNMKPVHVLTLEIGRWNLFFMFNYEEAERVKGSGDQTKD